MGKMPQYPVCAAWLLLATLPSIAPPAAEDTAHLAASLEAVRGQGGLRNDQYQSLQRVYLAWIDDRLKMGGDAESMNQELRAAGLFPRQLDIADEIDADHTGYLGLISTKPIRGRNDAFVVAAGIYRGLGCTLDVTAVLYQRRPLRRLAYLNADPGQTRYAFYLSGLDVGEEDSAGERIVASGWVISNCTSTWNGKRIRIDRLKASSIEHVLVRDLNAQDRDEGDNVAAQVGRDVVTFRYQGGIGDGDLLSGPAIARYQIISDRAVLTSPVALTRAGFIHEWLRMADTDAACWSEPEAMAIRKSAASSIGTHGFQWERIAQCKGSPPVWEIAVRPNESEKLEVSRISGSRVTELRMMAVSDKVTQSCTPEDISMGLSGVAAELPW